ncbi:C25 family cysteine peptidase [Dyadobacter sp. BHUBP1]|uniref:putative type IX secretion system sortase PorU2 n=1 Tax=Dyadobacter sp. BHUBP1 TaxID=3424178 RepID=UPI003D32CB62
MWYFTRQALLIVAFLISYQLQAQWGAPYANSWIDYNKPYVKIGILKKGLHKVAFSSLPKGFPVGSPEKLQLWHRGKEISIISTANQEIIFYAVPNDGASDSLLYRPMSSRVNPYFSMYGDEGTYFLTVGDKPGKRSGVVDQPDDPSVPVVEDHNEQLTKIFQQDYSLGTKSSINPGFFNSYFELGASRTSVVYKNKEEAIFEFKLSDFVQSTHNPTVKLLLHGRSRNDRKLECYIGKSKNALRLAKVSDNFGFAATECVFDIRPEDTDSGKGGVLVIRSVSDEPLERFSIAYYSIEFAQVLRVGSVPVKEFSLNAVADKWNKILVKGVPSKFRFIDISDVENPVVLTRRDETLMIPRQPGKKQVLLATSEIFEVASSNIARVQLMAHDPKSTNYIIITTEALREGATSYAKYRASPAGGNFKPAIFEIQDIYNQFNYGEPSPVAIKKFMAYMLSDGTENKYLFLIGKSITQNERMIRELPGEVPTIGFPGSDALLVEGIAGGAVNVPVIPVGRLSAVTNQNITDYLQKVIAYESSGPGESGWRKKILHLSGGKTTSEIVQLRDYLRALEPMVQQGIAGGTVKSYVKQQPTQEVESVDISKDVNEGVGMITFFGHGSTITTDPDIGHVRDEARGYHNLNKYPVLYFNGCGVGNVFCNRFNPTPPNPKAADRITLSLDWLVAPHRGAIAVIASSFESFVSPGMTYLNSLYHHMFENPATVSLPIGNIQLAVANDILSKYKDQYNIAYVHQSLLQGDPALRLLAAEKPDYAVETNGGITLLSDSADKTIGESDSLRVHIDLVNFGRFKEDQTVPLEINWSGKQATHSARLNIRSFPNKKLLKLSFPREKDLNSIKVQIDPGHILNELTRENNNAELLIDWDLVKDKQMFSTRLLKDNIPPVLVVQSEGRLLKQGDPIFPDPSFRISLNDDNALSLDTTLIDIFIKLCADDRCHFERLSYVGDKLVMQAQGSRGLTLDYASRLGPGKYEMLVNARDRAGIEVSQPYRMCFEVVKPDDSQQSLVVSPNPATSYVRFELRNAKSLALKWIRYIIYNQRGIGIEDKTLTVAAGAPVVEWFWIPKETRAGVYSYQVFLEDEERAMLDNKTGKVVVQP